MDHVIGASRWGEQGGGHIISSRWCIIPVIPDYEIYLMKSLPLIIASQLD